jgi:hypothetical protein
MTTDRAFELIFGLVLVGPCVYALYTGQLWSINPYLRFSRDENPEVYWPTLLIALGIGLAFLFGVEDTFLRGHWLLNLARRLGG